MQCIKTQAHIQLHIHTVIHTQSCTGTAGHTDTCLQECALWQFSRTCIYEYATRNRDWRNKERDKGLIHRKRLKRKEKNIWISILLAQCLLTRKEEKGDRAAQRMCVKENTLCSSCYGLNLIFSLCEWDLYFITFDKFVAMGHLSKHWYQNSCDIYVVPIKILS